VRKSQIGVLDDFVYDFVVFKNCAGKKAALSKERLKEI